MGFENKKLNRRDFLSLTGSAVLSELVNAGSQSKLTESGEAIPTNESVTATFAKILEGQPATERRKEEDAHGVYLWEIEFEVEGGTVELNYMRKGRHTTGGSANATKIYVVYFGDDGMPEGGTDIAVFENDSWKMV